MNTDHELLLVFREFFGWCLVVNVAFLAVSTFGMVVGREQITGIHARMFGVDDKALPAVYFRYLAYFKIAVIVFNLTPYVVLHIMV